MAPRMQQDDMIALPYGASLPDGFRRAFDDASTMVSYAVRAGSQVCVALQSGATLRSLIDASQKGFPVACRV